MNKLKSILKGNIGNNNNNNSSDSDVIIGFTYVAKLSEIKTNVPFKVNFNGSSIGIYKTEFNGKKKIYALANKCSHQGFPLSCTFQILIHLVEIIYLPKLSLNLYF